jgi:trehalose 6-phosphate phosphatase
MTMRAQDVVAEVVARSDRAGIMLDLDGTLAPIVSRPEDVQVLPGVHGILERLAGRVATVALISGRASGDVRRVVDVPGVRIVGTHGLEDEPPLAPDTLRRIEEVAETVGAWVEVKGAAVAVHFRALPDPAAAAEATAGPLGRVAAAHGLELVPGKAILELMPVGAPRKGDAVQLLVEGDDLQAVLFAGDDVGDVDAFATLERLRAGGLWTCAVAASGPDVAPAVIEGADLVVEGPAGVVGLLGAIAEQLDVMA